MSNIGNEFLEKTKYEYRGKSDQEKGVERPPLELEYDRSRPVIDLPSPAGFIPPDNRLRQLIDQRRSVRRYSNDPLSLGELSYLLWCTQGVQGMKDAEATATFRTVPSAGARHAFETLLLINNVDGQEPGLYRFLALDHKLTKLDGAPDLADQLVDAAFNQRMIKNAAVTFFWVAVAKRMTWRYDVRGYRFLFLDAGHVGQNLYLAAESIGAGTCAIAAYDDNKTNRTLGLDGEEQFVIYISPVGKK